MWDKLSRYLPQFHSAVLTGIDSQGYPFSLRCHPELDAGRQVLRIALPGWLELKPGPASLLCHKHDDRLWNLKSFVVLGTLGQDQDGWSFLPVRLIPGMGVEGLRGYLKFILNGRRMTARYLKQHGLPRPKIPWDEVEALVTVAKSGK